jgi:CheY-like chemotaxis protein
MAYRKSSRRPYVLVVEDDPIIRMLAMDIVEEAGLLGIEAESADDAVSILESRDDIRVVFTDINMPGSWDGMKLANCIRDRWPPVEIILTSGKSRPLAHELPERAVFIPKPYQISKLVQMLNKFAS